MYIQNGALAIILKDRDNVCQNIFHSACYSCASAWNQSGYSYKKSQIFPEQRKNQTEIYGGCFS